MDDVRIILSVLWIAVMLCYLLGDVLRIISGDIILGEVEGKKLTQGMVLGIAILMVILIIMVPLSLMLDNPVILSE